MFKEKTLNYYNMTSELHRNIETKNIPKLVTYEDYFSKNKNKFFYVRDIRYTLDKNKINNKHLKKKDLLDMLEEFFNTLKYYKTNHSAKIAKLQSLIKNHIHNKKYRYTGLGFIYKDLCVNREEFYTLETFDELDPMYFFSYKDENNKIFFFDIRSIKTLIENKQSNPFTTKPIPKYAIDSMNKRLAILLDMNYTIEFEKDKLTPEQEFNNDVLSIFQKLDLLNISAGGTNPDWFTNLTFSGLIKFYSILEDIWNYRTGLSNIQKKEIIKDKIMFPIHPSKIAFIPANNSNKRKLQYMILDEIEKLISTSDNTSHKCTGGYYTLIGLTEVSYECAEAMPWLVQHSVNNNYEN